MGDVYWGVHLPLAGAAHRLGIRCAVETGTFFGSGAIHLAAMFDRVWSIERDANLHQFCSDTYGTILPHVTFMQGDSSSCLENVMQVLEGPALFVLDAHWFPTEAIQGATVQQQCPVLQELSVIASAGGCARGSVILIDDADMFLGSLPSPFNRSDFPSIVNLIDMLRQQLAADFVTVHEDVIIAGPDELRSAVTRYITASHKVGAPRYKAVGLR